MKFKLMKKILQLIIPVLSLSFIANTANTLDYPHTGVNNIGCNSCHFVFETEPTLLPPWTSQPPQDIDDTAYNKLCRSCHNDIDAPRMKTHSSLQIDNGYGDWTVECKTCHNPHYQKQFRTYGSVSYLYQGTVSSVTTTTLTRSGANWTTDQYKGLIVVPNISKKDYNYRITGNTDDTLTVEGPIKLTQVSVGNTFAIIYGKLVKEIIPTPNSGDKTVRFFNSTGTNSFADGNVTYDGVCEVCHTQTTHFRNDGSGSDQLHSNMNYPAGTNCADCHKHVNGFGGMGGGAHTTHVIEGYGPQLQCADCHGTNNPPLLADGQNLANTTVCTNCHSANGAATAKQYWSTKGSSQRTDGSWAVVEGEESFCGSCHDSTPGNTERDGTGVNAPDIIGDSTTYGFFVTGHGKSTGNYPRLSWQDTSATGNPAANLQGCGQCHGIPPFDEDGWPNPPFPPTPQVTPCSFCHDLTTTHYNNADKRLRSGFGNDQNNTNCKQCHSFDGTEGTAATSEPHFYTLSADYENSAHKDILCTQCHDVHGSSGNYAGMTKANKQNLCLQSGCHSGQSGHAMGNAFNKGGKTYSLECISCHNVHIVTGRFTVDSTKSPLTKLSDNLIVWGDSSGEKMNNYTGSGEYRTPNGDTLSGSQLPDYPTFCLDCHGQDMSPGSIHGNISWGDMHGTAASNSPNGGGNCPNWYMCGLASGRDGDDCVGTQEDCWPVMTRSLGDDRFSRSPYDHIERIANVNFVMSCNDCHVTHVSGSGKLRSTINGSPASMSNWAGVCNACHYQGGVDHAQMSCGAANSCHDANPNPRFGFPSESLHGMPNGGHGGGDRIFNPDLVLDMRFENNLNDSGTWRLHSKWYSTSGSFAAGKSGQSAVLGEDIGVQVGTTNGYWSNDEGNHGTWKYTEMKYNTTLEAWVYPTDNAKSEYTIFSKNVGVSNNGSYSFTLKKVNGVLRAAFNMAADNNGFTQDGRAGVRGAYSSVAVPLNNWTHIAATFDTSGADRNPSDPAVGRIRIYVNGEDVTTSDSSGNNMQPGVNETSMYAFSENSPWNQVGVCYVDAWCASEFTIGGFDWEASNFIGRIDEAKLWNVTKNAAYFAPYDSQAGPYISEVIGLIGSNQLTVYFSEGVYTNTGSSGALVATDFALTDADGNNPRTITGVTHTAGSSTAVITMSAPLTVSDVNADTLSAASNAIYDNNNLAAGTETVTIGLSPQCPTSPVSIQINEASGSTYVMDTQSILYGAVYGGGATLTGSEYSGGGDGSGRYIMFDYNTTCLQASTVMTIETRIKPTGLAGTGNYIRRILARDGSGNYQISVWRNNTAYPGRFNAPDGEGSIALWINPVDAHGGNAWKPVLTNYTGAANGSENNCPIVSDHWYQVKSVWNTNKPGGTPGQFFQPADIYIDDQGTDGNGAGESWTGYINCTDSDQSLKTDVVKFYTGDVINAANGNFAIGTNRSAPTNNLFNGLIDWIRWNDAVE